MSAIVFATRGIPATAASRILSVSIRMLPPHSNTRPVTSCPRAIIDQPTFVFAPASELKAGVFEFDASPVCRAKAESFSTKLALRASLLTRFYFTCSVAELIDVPRADYHFDFWEDFVTGSTYRGDVASELTAHIVLKLNK
jgi:hypothetical protein